MARPWGEPAAGETLGKLPPRASRGSRLWPWVADGSSLRLWRRKKFPGKREGCKHERRASTAAGIHRVEMTVRSALADAASKLRGTRAPRDRVQPGHGADFSAQGCRFSEQQAVRVQAETAACLRVCVCVLRRCTYKGKARACARQPRHGNVWK